MVFPLLAVPRPSNFNVELLFQMLHLLHLGVNALQDMPTTTLIAFGWVVLILGVVRRRLLSKDLLAILSKVQA